jgi:hypothetical protein
MVNPKILTILPFFNSSSVSPASRIHIEPKTLGFYHTYPINSDANEATKTAIKLNGIIFSFIVSSSNIRKIIICLTIVHRSCVLRFF